MLEQEHHTDEVLTWPVARQVFFLSFALSQGSDGLQSTLFCAVAFLRPAWRLDEEVETRLVRALHPIVQRLVEQGLHGSLSSDDISYELANQMMKFRSFLAAKRIESRDELSFFLLTHLVERDLRFLRNGLSRHRPAKDVPFASYFDPHLSLVCHYVLGGQRMGCKVFDEMLSELRTALTPENILHQHLQENTTVRTNLEEVIAVHNRWHPHQRVVSPLPSS